MIKFNSKLSIQVHCLLLSAGLFIPPSYATDQNPDPKELNFKHQIQELDKAAKSDDNIGNAEQTALNAQELRRRLAAHYHSSGQFTKIVPLYEELIERDKQLVYMGSLPKQKLAADCKYLADIYSYLNRNSEAEKMYKLALSEYNGPESIEVRKAYAGFLRKTNRKAEAEKNEKDIAEIQAEARQKSPAPVTSPTGASSRAGTLVGKLANLERYKSDFARVDAIQEKAKKAMSQGQYYSAEEQLERGIGLISEEIEPELKRKMLDNFPGYGLDRWHNCFMKKAELWKEIADAYYKEKKTDKMAEAYENRVNSFTGAGVDIVDIEPDYAYLVSLLQTAGDNHKAIIYNIHLLKARRLKYGSESNPEVLATLDKFAGYMRSLKDDDKAAQLEARAKAIRSGSKPLPKLWFAY